MVLKLILRLSVIKENKMKKKLKNNIKKTGRVLAILAIALCAVVILFGCVNPFMPPNPGDIQEGKGYFILSLTGFGTQSRTIMPDIPVAHEWVSYKLVFTPAPTGTARTEYRSHSGLSEPIELDAGTYTLTVYAYTYETDENDLADEFSASGPSTAPIPVSAGGSVSGTVNLTAVSPLASGVGHFSWVIDYPTDVLDVKMVIEPISPTEGDTVTYRFPGVDATGEEVGVGKEGNIELDAGFYRVIFYLTKDAQTQVRWRETLHIYRNMTSYYGNEEEAVTFTNNHFITNSYIVDFIHNWEGNPFATVGGAYGNTDISVFHGALTSAPTVTPNPNSTNDWYLEGWYISHTSFIPANKWDFAANTVTKHEKLYAHWIPVLKGNLVIKWEDKTDLDNQNIIIDEAATDDIFLSGELTYQWLLGGSPVGSNQASFTFGNAQAGTLTLRIERAGYHGYVIGHGNPAIVRTGPRGSTEDNPLFVSSLAQLR